jgi:16S rRNA (guanine(966)-N(2))-methyltransferase RsmD
VPEAGRVITGTARGTRLRAPGGGTRPLSDRIKQALFAIVEAERADAWEVPMLDAFAGSGAAAIEALSRGAPRALLVEADPRAAAVARSNLALAGVASRAVLVQRDALAVLRAGREALRAAADPFGVALLDPPYERTELLTASLGLLGDADLDWLDDEACVVAKHFWRDRPPEAAGDLRLARERRFGETALGVYRRRTKAQGSGDR